MNDIDALRWSHLLSAATYGAAAAMIWVLWGSPSALLAVALFLPAAALAAITWNEMVKEEYR